MAQIIGNRYELSEQIGAGGMGTVYRGLDRQTNQAVAIKKLKADLAQPEIIARFKREGELLRELDHPNIVKILDIIEEDAQHYLIIEFVSGGDLNARIKHGQLEIEQVLRLAIDLADALTRAHKLDIIHRDLKPANVLLTETGTLRLTDFGIAHEGSRERVTDPGVVVGTVDYLPPEAIRGESLDQRADIWAFGVMLSEMLTGQRPFSDKSISATITRILTGALPDLETLRPDAPIALVDLVYRMLARDREARIRSVRQVGLELEDLLHNRQTPAVRERFATPTPDVTVVDRPKHNLPASSSGFVGREEELASLGRLLDNANTHLVTILAPGGMGKTRLALQMGQRYHDSTVGLQSAFVDGVYYVALAPLSSHENIVPTIAEAIGFQFSQGADPQQQLMDYLHRKKMLLILDNFEHLLDGVQIVSDMVRAAAQVKILVTSRERLNLSGETLFTLSGMDFPDWETPADALTYGAVKLFLQSATQAKPDFELTAGELPFLARICRLVAGMPLGIVLTAAWVNMLSLSEIAGEIERSLDFLETDLRDIPERQRSIRGIFDYSYGRLSEDEQVVFQKLSVFHGGFTREAAQTVTGAALKTLMALINKSLLRRDPDGRYQIHELLRQYGDQRLTSAVRDAVLENYARYYVELIFKDVSGSQAKDQNKAALEIVETEAANLDAAWRHMVIRQKITDLGIFLENYRLAYDIRGQFRELLTLVTFAIDNLSPVSPEDLSVLGNLLLAQSWFLVTAGFPDKAEQVVNRALINARQRSDPRAIIEALNTLAYVQLFLARFVEMQQTAHESVAISREMGSTVDITGALYWLAGAYMRNREWATAKPIAEECLKLSQETGDLNQEAHVRGIILAPIEHGLGNYQMAQDYCHSALRYYEEVNLVWGIAMVKGTLGKIATSLGNYEEALLLYQQKFELMSIGQLWEVLNALLDIAELRVVQGIPEDATAIFSFILQHPASFQEARNIATESLVRLKAELPSEVYDAAWARGRSWDFDQAVAFVLKQLE